MNIKLLALLCLQILCNAQHIPDTAIKQHLSGKILLVINFNQPHYDNIPFLKNLYGSYFDTLVFYGPKPDPRIEAYSYQGVYWTSSYGTLVDAMQKYPDYDGYFWLNDDCALFTWNLINLDIQKPWMSPPGFANVPSLKAGFSDISKNERSPFWQCSIYRTQLTNLYNHLPAHLKRNIKDNYGEYTIPWGPAEGCYIPRKYASDFIAIAQQCLQENIVVEQAMHFIFACLEKKSQQETLPILWTEYLIDKDCTPKVNSITQVRQCPLFAQCLRNKLALFHHMKFSDPKNWQLITHLYRFMTKPLSAHQSSPFYRVSKKLHNNILLIIHFKQSHYDAIPFFQKLYSSYFENIIFYGDQMDPWVNRCAHRGKCEGICAATLAKIMADHPQYDGYFWLESDCLLFTWQIASLDPQKIWCSDTGLQACYLPKKDMLSAFEHNRLGKQQDTIALRCKHITNQKLIAPKSKYDVKRSALFLSIKQDNLMLVSGIDYNEQKNRNYVSYLYQIAQEPITSMKEKRLQS